MSKKKILISKILLATITIVVLMVVFFYKPEHSEEDIKKRQDQERMVQYILDKAELKNNEEINRIKVIEFKKNFLTGTWKCEIQINGKYNIMLKEDELGGEIRTSFHDADEIRINKEKVNKINNVEREYL